MAIKGTIFVHHNAATRQLEVHAVNHGESPGTLTHNIRATEVEAFNESGVTQHDNQSYGHNNPTPAGTDQNPQTATMQFPIGGTYKSEDLTGHQRIPRPVTIQPGMWLRVGFRQRAFAALPIPPPGGIVEIPYESMKPQTNSSMARSQWASYYQFLGFNPEPMVRSGNHVPPALKAMLAQRSPHVVKGSVTIAPVADEKDPSVLRGWDVVVKNDATGTPKEGETHGFTATVVLTDGAGVGEKNAGLGLESMPCPGEGTEARQHIVAGGSYGVQADPGCPVRLGIRGYASAESTLPQLHEGPRTLDLAAFTRSFADTQSDWFDGDKLGAKLGEKKNRVDFFANGKRINDTLPDTIYTGNEAVERAEFKQPPKVVVKRVAASEERPAGWEVSVESLLPDADKLGPVGFKCKPWIDVDGRLVSARCMTKTALTPTKRSATWFIPADAEVGGAALKKGTPLVIDTGPLGWRATIPLPGARETFDSTADPLATWVLRESDYHRAGLIIGS